MLIKYTNSIDMCVGVPYGTFTKKSVLQRKWNGARFTTYDVYVLLLGVTLFTFCICEMPGQILPPTWEQVINLNILITDLCPL